MHHRIHNLIAWGLLIGLLVLGAFMYWQFRLFHSLPEGENKPHLYLMIASLLGMALCVLFLLGNAASRSYPLRQERRKAEQQLFLEHGWDYDD